MSAKVGNLTRMGDTVGAAADRIQREMQAAAKAAEAQEREAFQKDTERNCIYVSAAGAPVMSLYADSMDWSDSAIGGTSPVTDGRTVIPMDKVCLIAINDNQAAEDTKRLYNELLLKLFELKLAERKPPCKTACSVDIDTLLDQPVGHQ